MKNKNSEKIFWGVFLILGAIFILVSKMGLVNGVGIWGIIWTIFFAAMLIKSLVSRSIPGTIFCVAFLCIIYSEPLGIEAITPWPILIAALLLSIGLSMIFKDKKNNYTENYTRHDEHFASIDETNDDSVSIGTKFGSSIKYINSDNFLGARIKCTFGAMKVYFDKAHIVGDSAVIDLDVSFGGMELYIPKEWNVVINASTSFGGFEEKNRNMTSGAPTVRVQGNVSFSGVTIIYI